MKKLGLIAALALVVLTNLSVSANEDNWAASKNDVEFYESAELESFNELPAEFSFNIRQSCQKQQIRTKTLDRFNIIPLVDNVYKKACVVNMSFGQISSDYLKLDGYRDAIESKVNGTIFPVPLTSSAYFVDRSGIYPSTGRLFFIENLPDNINIKKDFLGNYSFTLKSNGTPIIYNGSQPYVDAHGLSLSNNNGWLAGVFVHGKTFVLDRSTHNNFITVGGSVVYNQGQQPAPRTAVSNDGKFVSLALRDKAPVVYGTACANVDCNIKLYEPTFAQGINNAEYKRMYFKPDGHLQAYIFGEYSSQQKIKKFEIFSSQQKMEEFLEQGEKRLYLALGDSFASGEGAFNYRDGTDHPDNRCHQSLVAYPELISQELSFDEHGSVACSGALLRDVFNTEAKNNKSAEEYYNTDIHQSEGKEGDEFDPVIYPNFLPGYREQYLQVKNFAPSTITVSISGNDIGFGDKIKTCLWSPAPCYDTLQDRASIFEEIKYQFEPLKLRLQKIKEAAPDNAKIYAIGYPQLFPDGGGSNCELNTPFEQSERMLANDIVTDLNSMIKTASAAVGVSYVDAENAMNNHRLCDPGEKAINGLTAGNDALGFLGYPLGKESFHPNQLGHALYKNVILDQTNNLADENPAPDTSITEDDISSSLLGVLSDSDIESIGKIPLSVYSPDMVSDIVYVQGSQESSVNFSEGSLKPNQQYSLSIHSEPTALGSFTASNDGSASQSFDLPEGFEAGFHTLRVTGPSVNGEQVSFYKVIYVAVNEEDFDGDGRENQNEKCLIGEPANIDQDEDGVDDACDPEIGEAPFSPEEPAERNGLPVIIPGVNDTNTSPGVQQTSSNLQQTQVSGAQPAVSGFQTTSTSSQPSEDNVGELLNQGVSVPALPVVSAPYSSAPSAIATPVSQPLANTESSGGSPGLLLVFIGALIVVFAATTWNRYIKTPIPAPKTKRR